MIDLADRFLADRMQDSIHYIVGIERLLKLTKAGSAS